MTWKPSGENPNYSTKMDNSTLAYYFDDSSSWLSNSSDEWVSSPSRGEMGPSDSGGSVLLRYVAAAGVTLFSTVGIIINTLFIYVIIRTKYVPRITQHFLACVALGDLIR